MMRLAPTGYLRMSQTKQLEMTFGGGEANVAVSLANYGKEARFVTGLPDNDIGAACIGELRRWGVDISKIITKPGRMGIYFCEKGASQRPSKVIYDRADSVVSKLSVTDFDWDNILEGAEWFHFTGITPALSDSMAEATLAACQTAKKKRNPDFLRLKLSQKALEPEKAGKDMQQHCP